MGVSDAQAKDPEETIDATRCDVVLSATPIDTTRVLKVNKPMIRATCDLAEVKPGQLKAEVQGGGSVVPTRFLGEAGPRMAR
ncbi:MAG TPA: hypothetical protein VJ549_08725 [Geothrix sp.]|nr:hypothetical protein [Geothrix sp.]